MIRRKSGKPKQLEEEDNDQQDGPQRVLAQETTLDEFLVNMHQETVEGVPTPSEPSAPADPNTLPSLAWLDHHFKTKSAKIRHLTVDRKFPVKDVAKHLGIKYQHVRNVTNQQLKRGPNESFHLAEGQKAKSVETDE